jgi:hypothetical protein
MFADLRFRVTAVAAGASLIALCSVESSAVRTGAMPLAPRSAHGPVLPAFAPRAFIDDVAGVGKLPAPLRHAGKIARAVRNGSITCTTVSPSNDVLSALEEPGTTATAAIVINGNTSQTIIKQNIDGSECDIAVYVDPSATHVQIADTAVHDGIRAGIVVDGAPNVKLTGNEIYNIGDHAGSVYTPDGVQYGFGLALVNGGSGEIVLENSVFGFQKDGILAFDNVSLELSKNSVTGAGPVNYIASNGIEMDGVNFTQVTGNRVSLDQYTGPNYGASGYLICGDTLAGNAITSPSQIRSGNAAFENDIEIYVAPNSDCS